MFSYFFLINCNILKMSPIRLDKFTILCLFPVCNTGLIEIYGLDVLVYGWLDVTWVDIFSCDLNTRETMIAGAFTSGGMLV